MIVFIAILNIWMMSGFVTLMQSKKSFFEKDALETFLVSNKKTLSVKDVSLLTDFKEKRKNISQKLENGPYFISDFILTP